MTGSIGEWTSAVSCPFQHIEITRLYGTRTGIDPPRNSQFLSQVYQQIQVPGLGRPRTRHCAKLAVPVFE